MNAFPLDRPKLVYADWSCRVHDVIRSDKNGITVDMDGERVRFAGLAPRFDVWVEKDSVRPRYVWSFTPDAFAASVKAKRAREAREVIRGAVHLLDGCADPDTLEAVADALRFILNERTP